MRRTARGQYSFSDFEDTLLLCRASTNHLSKLQESLCST
jgi:hypothetical protein